MVGPEDLLKQPNVECKTLCDVDGNVLDEKAAEQVKMGEGQNLYWTRTTGKVLEDKDIDAVIIGTPDHWHCLPTVEACAGW